jgi:hypothetical protein
VDEAIDRFMQEHGQQMQMSAMESRRSIPRHRDRLYDPRRTLAVYADAAATDPDNQK